MLDLLLYLLLLLVCGSIGLPIARLLPSPPFEWRVLLAPTFGASVLAVVVNVAYGVGVPPGTSLAVAGGAGAILLAVEGVRVFREARSGKRGGGPSLRAPVAAWIAASLLLLAPRWIGGDQFSVFQGNHWDTFGYLESALIYAREPCDEVEGAGEAERRRNPMVMTAQRNLHARPAVHLLYGAFSRIAPAQGYRLHYPFLVFFLAQAMLVAAFLLRSWFPRGPVPAVLAAAAVFPLGFWGQYVFDINAWSQIASTGPLLLLAGLLVEIAARPRVDGPSWTEGRAAAVIAVVVAGTAYLYPESLLYHLAVLAPLAAAAIALRAWRSGRFSPRPFLPLLGLGGILAGAGYWRGTLGFVVEQVQSTAGPPVPWWRFFQKFLAGRDDAWGVHGFVTDLLDGIPGGFGLYFLTPGGPSDGVLPLLQRVALLALVAAVLAALGVALLGRSGAAAGGEAPRDDGLSRIRLASLAAVLLLVPAAVYASRENYWPAGKTLSYASPLLMTLLAAPLLADGTRRPRRWIAGAFVALQLAMGVARVVASSDPSGIGYAAPYPSVQDPALKERLRWELEPLVPHLEGARRVLVAPMNEWTSHYLMTFLEARGLEWFALGTVYTNFAAGPPLPPVPLPWQADAMIGLSPGGFVVQYAGGRAPAWVAWPRQVR